MLGLQLQQLEEEETGTRFSPSCTSSIWDAWLENPTQRPCSAQDSASGLCPLSEAARRSLLEAPALDSAVLLHPLLGFHHCGAVGVVGGGGSPHGSIQNSWIRTTARLHNLFWRTAEVGHSPPWCEASLT